MPPSTPFRRLEDVPERLKGGAVAIGNFDGVHLGHKSVLQAAVAAAGGGAPVLALTFEPHPRAWFSGAPVFRLTPEIEKAERLVEAGADAVVSLDFAALAARPAQDFIHEVLVDGLGVSHVSVGFDFRFGAGRAGDAASLKEAGERNGFGVTVVAALQAGGAPVSSSRIRAHLAAGEIEAASALSGHDWRAGGTVVHGAKLGRTLGYPTANIALPPETELRHGVYAVRARVGGATHDGVASFGRRPTFDDGPVLLETFVFDFTGDLYDRRMDVSFVSFLRGEEAFASAEALIEQMDRDAAEARARLSRAARR